MADIGSALTGKYVGEVKEGTPEYEAWKNAWSEVLPLNGMTPEQFMARRPGEEGAFIGNLAPTHLFIRKPAPQAEDVPMS